MSEIQSRPPATRGRSSARGGRSSYGSTRQGPRSNTKQINGDADASADQGELGELKRQYSSQLSTLREFFPDWADIDLLLAVQESDGDLQNTIEKITEGNVSQFSEIKKKDRSRSKAKDIPVGGTDIGTVSARAPRGRGVHDSARPSRGRTERGGRGGHTRGSRGGAHTGTNGTRGAGSSVPTGESSAWDTPTGGDASEEPIEAEKTPVSVAAAPKPPQEPPKKTWASQLFSKPLPPPVVPKPAVQPPQQQEVPASSSQPIEAHDSSLVEPAAAEPALAVPEVVEPVSQDQETKLEALTNGTPEQMQEEAAATITPSKDELTEDNVEHLPDASLPPPTETAASTTGSTAGPPTPLNNAQQQPIGRPVLGGFATTAHKATAVPHRATSFQRRMIEQQEAVVMPGNHAIDRTAVQFGSLGLNGEDDDALNVDDDREEAETRTQPPTHSPTQPRASLPPAPRQQQGSAEGSIPEVQPAATTAPKQAPGLPPPQQQQSAAGQTQSQSPQNTNLGAQAMQQQGSRGGQQYDQFGRYTQANLQSETAAPAQKPYDPFGQQLPQSGQYDSFSGQSQAPSQQQNQAHLGGFSSGPNDYSSYYTSDHQRYQNYYNNAYNSHQSGPAQQEAGGAQQRSGSGFGAGPTESTFSSNQSQQTQGRYGDTQNSGHNTPNPSAASQHQAGPQTQHGHQHHAQPGHGAQGYQYNHPYYNSPYYQQYMSQYGAYGQGYGNFGKGGMYGQPHGYGMSPQTSYDQHSSSPANVSGFGNSVHGRESAVGGGLGDYGRSSSTQPSQTQQHTGTATSFGGMPDVFGRSQGGFAGQNQSYTQQPSTSQQGSTEDSLKAFGESNKQTSGPSSSSLSQSGRPGSAANNTPGQSNQSSHPPQSHQQGFGGYPNHQLQGGPGGQFGLSGLGGHQAGAQSHQGGGYGGYSGFGNYGSYGRGGWGGNYGQH